MLPLGVAPYQYHSLFNKVVEFCKVLVFFCRSDYTVTVDINFQRKVVTS